MNVKALRKFRDKYTGEVYMRGDEFDATEERVTEMNGGKYGKLVEGLPDDMPPLPDVNQQETPELLTADGQTENSVRSDTDDQQADALDAGEAEQESDADKPADAPVPDSAGRGGNKPARRGAANG